MEATERARKNRLLLLSVWLRIVSGFLGCALVALMWSPPSYAPLVRTVVAIVSPEAAALVIGTSALVISPGLELIATRLTPRYSETQAPSRALRWVGIALCWLCALATLITLAVITVIRFGVLL